MKVHLLVYLLLFFVLSLKAQAPQSLSYQAIIRGVDNQLVSDQKVNLRISILRGSVDGKNIYRETHQTSTNINGLISVKIGEGTTAQHFSGIDWQKGPYFLKSEVDPDGGTRYSIIGTTQLISVPYALHAASADTVMGDIKETDPFYQQSLAAQITANDTTRWGQAVNDPNDSPPIKTYNIGDFAQGGVIFWLDETQQHGLVCAIHDVGKKVGNRKMAKWMPRNTTNEFLNVPTADGIGAGYQNSINISLYSALIDHTDTIAAWYCMAYSFPDNSIGGTTDLDFDTLFHYADFYLPSRYELILLQKQHVLVSEVCRQYGGDPIEDRPYLSSCQYDEGSKGENAAKAWSWYFSNGNEQDSGGDVNDKDVMVRVRPIRKF